MAVLAVVIVLEHDRVGRASPFQQLEAGGDRQAPAERVLVARRHHDRVGRPRHPSQCIDDEPVGVDGGGHGADAASLEGPSRRRVAGVLDRDHGLATGEQGERGCRERDRLARPRRDHDVVGGAGHPSGLAQVVGDLRSEAVHAERRWRLGGDLEGRRVAPCRAPRAGVDARGGGSARLQIDARPRRVTPDRGVLGKRGAVRRGSTVGPREVVRELGDAGRRALPHLEVALAGELFVRADDRAARDAELGCEGARRRHGVARTQRSAEDAASQALDELHADRLAGVPPDDEDRTVHTPSRDGDWTAGCCGNWTARRTSVFVRLAA